MLKTELLEIIANGENSGVEFKRDDIRPEQLAKEIVALVNFQGGQIILGVEDDGTISGLRRPNAEEWVMNVVRDKIHPQILPFYEKIKIDDGVFVAIITFPLGISKPYVLRDRQEEKVFIRIGSTSQLATREQQMRLFELGGMLHTEVLPVARTNSDCLDRSRLENYLSDILQDPDIPKADDDWEIRLAGLGFLNEPNGLCSVAGLLLFGKNPRQYLKQAGLRVFAFDGEDKEYKANLDLIIDAPLVGRWDVTESVKQLIDNGLIENFIEQVKPFITQEVDEIDEDFRRELEWFYPSGAVREALINALAHRDWTRFVDIEVGIYSDRLEVISPGALQNSMTVDKMVLGQRSPRNPIIMEVLRDYGYVDARGMGVRTKMIPLMRKFNHCDPVFELTDDYLKTILFRKVADAE
ncbi:ATP-dependent DNA helicase RecG [Bathymodiolus japonicus methanotrophic gill symbiont]|uniref:RNA-binding domain-containing protein n=1 Tax=Bathymodiolus japonicus methanotrophic gill symbiont TaxID=113269 RepID=UPI001B5EB2FD|nr:RNA-binding domain-containing protein [Bathymodiolus japonicus methanotrophic gill symbiont]GFO73292.1 ATP-dependent DNA helicase RecG [Bathymodiolus japonicus methanotrophic gill symbiont]